MSTPMPVPGSPAYPSGLQIPAAPPVAPNSGAGPVPTWPTQSPQAIPSPAYHLPPSASADRGDFHVPTVDETVAQPVASSEIAERTTASGLEPALNAGREPTFAGTGLDTARLWTLDQQSRPLGDLDGDLFLLDFFGSWCGPCRRCIPKLNDLESRYGNSGVRVIGIACEYGDQQDAVAAAEEIRRQAQIHYAVLASPLDEPCAVRDHFHVQRYPTLVLINRQGQILFQGSSGDAKTFTALERAIQQAVSPSAYAARK